MQTKSLLPNLGNGNKIIFGGIVGSQAYGTNTEDSDVDKKWIYVQSSIDFFINGYKPYIEINKDEVALELNRFIELAQKANPYVLELLFLPEECILYKHDAFELLLGMKKQFLTKQCIFSFGGSAMDYLEKACELNMKSHFTEKDIMQKSILDFCYWITDLDDVYLGEYYSIPIKERFTRAKINTMGAEPLDHLKDAYNLFFDIGVDYGGIVDDWELATDVMTTKVPPKATCQGVLFFDRAAYEKHCKKYKEYLRWLDKKLNKKNVQTEDGAHIDGKAVAHCIRLVDVAADIVRKRDLPVKRANAIFLKDIIRGRISAKNLIKYARETMTNVKKEYASSTLPDKFCDHANLKLVNFQIRNMIDKELKAL
jgi:hypothetical protein